MKELVIVSGKGGTGKTSLTAAFAELAGDVVLCDADVDAADLHLLSAPIIREQHDFLGGGLAEIRLENCIQCGLCREKCRWQAISEEYVVDPIGCEGCGVCETLCPTDAVSLNPKRCGEWFISDTRFGAMVHARLGVAEENSGKLVTLVRREAKNLAERTGSPLILTDGPPGVGCPVIASIGGATAMLIVTEPTVSGLHDLDRVVQLAVHFKVPSIVCINKFDLNLGKTAAIAAYAAEKGIHMIDSIPFDPAVTRAMVGAQTILEYGGDTAVSHAVRRAWDQILRVLEDGQTNII